MLLTSIAQSQYLDQEGHTAGKSDDNSKEYTIEVFVV